MVVNYVSKTLVVIGDLSRELARVVLGAHLRGAPVSAGNQCRRP